MILTAAWIMLLATLRDRAALVMAFLLPPALFMVFAAIFAGATGSDLKLKLGVLDRAGTSDSAQLVTALEGDRALRVTRLEHGDVEDLRALVRQGTVDAGVFLRSDLRRTGSEPPILVLQSQTKVLAGVIAQGQVQQLVAAKLPQVMSARVVAQLRSSSQLDPRVANALEKATQRSADSGGGGDAAAFKLVGVEEAGGSAGAHGNVLYYAASVAAIFMLFGAVHGALTLIDERASGTFDRLRLGARGIAAMIAGKFLFLVGQGTIQAAIIYLVARLVYHAAFEPALVGFWLGSCVLCAASAAALALLVCALCRTRKQAEGLTTFVVLLVSAAGGSMVPRYLMPPWFQQISWFTPNAWMIEALEKSVLPGAVVGDVAQAWLVLAALSLGGTFAAVLLAARRRL